MCGARAVIARQPRHRPLALAQQDRQLCVRCLDRRVVLRPELPAMRRARRGSAGRTRKLLVKLAHRTPRLPADVWHMCTRSSITALLAAQDMASAAALRASTWHQSVARAPRRSFRDCHDAVGGSVGRNLASVHVDSFSGMQRLEPRGAPHVTPGRRAARLIPPLPCCRPLQPCPATPSKLRAPATTRSLT